MKVIMVLFMICCISCNSNKYVNNNDEILNWDMSKNPSPTIPELKKKYPNKVFTIEWVEKKHEISSISLRNAEDQSETRFNTVNELISNLYKLEKDTSISYIFPCVRNGLTNKELNKIINACKTNSLVFHLHPGG